MRLKVLKDFTDIETLNIIPAGKTITIKDEDRALKLIRMKYCEKYTTKKTKTTN